MDNFDVSVQNEGTIFLFHLHSEAARSWVEENVEAEAQYFGRALVVEHRYAGQLAEEMVNEGGLTLE